MTIYVGIDLGTTNSAICTFDGEHLRLLKSPEQSDVTPSAIFVDRRGNRFVGTRAYNNAARSPESAALLFKRLMGSNTPLSLAAANAKLSPVECSAEILRTLYGYLPEEVRAQGDTGTVITVPAAFNQMQKDATLAAAELAGIGRVALMQEPVAAVMAVMRVRPADGLFVVFDFGGGTLDVAVAESIGRRVSLFAHGGIAMCGGRDFDRTILNAVVIPWLHQRFKLPPTLHERPQLKTLMRMAAWASEKAKIDLSARAETVISISEPEVSLRDDAGEEIYLDVPLDRLTLDRLIAPRVDEAIEATLETLSRAGVTPGDVRGLVFVGGPTQYAPLRERVCAALGIAGATDLNPLTAVAEGAAVFAESVDWTDVARSRKASSGALLIDAAKLEFRYAARTPADRAALTVSQGIAGASGQFQVDSLDTGWSSGRITLIDGATVELPLPRAGANTFKLFVFDAQGDPIDFEPTTVSIARTAAVIDAIPASSSIGLEVLDPAGGRSALDHLVRHGDPLPKKGSFRVRAVTSLAAGGNGSLRFKLWEGEVTHPVTDNRLIGALVISGHQIESGVIAVGAELVLEYEVRDSGHILLEVTAPSIGASFSSEANFYARQAGEVDYAAVGVLIRQEIDRLRRRVEELKHYVIDARMSVIEDMLADVERQHLDEADPETNKAALDRVLEAKLLFAQVRLDHGSKRQQATLDSLIKSVRTDVYPHCGPREVNGFDALILTTQRAIDAGTSDVDYLLEQLRMRRNTVLFRLDWWVIEVFKSLCGMPELFVSESEFARLKKEGEAAMAADKIDRLREVVRGLDQIRAGGLTEDDELLAAPNIARA